MTISWRLLIATLAICGLMGCSRHSLESKCIADESEIKTLGATNLSDLVSDFKIVPLETSDSLVIGEVTAVKKRAGALFVQADDRLMKFSLSGDYEREIVRKGPGPDEALNIADYEVRGNDIYLLAPGKIIVKNHVTGEKIKETAVPEYVGWSGRLRDTDSGLFVMARAPQEGENAILVMDVDAGEIKSEFFPAGKDWELASIELLRLDNDRYIHQYGRSTDLAVINSVSHQVDTIQLVSSADAISVEEFNKRRKELRSVNDLGLVTYHCLASSGSHLFWMGVLKLKEDGMTLYLYDKKTKSTIAVPCDKLKDDLTWSENVLNNRILGRLSGNESDDNAFIVALDSSELKDAIEGKTLKFEDAYKVLDKVEEDANPLIVFLEFKPIEH